MSAQKLITRRGEYDTIICAYAQGHIEHAKHSAHTQTCARTHTHTCTTHSVHTHLHADIREKCMCTYACAYTHVHIRMCMHMFNTLWEFAYSQNPEIVHYSCMISRLRNNRAQSFTPTRTHTETLTQVATTVETRQKLADSFSKGTFQLSLLQLDSIHSIEPVACGI